jgi:hypothetical protein
VVDINDFEGSFCDISEPGYYAVEKEGEEYIQISTLEVRKRKLICDFKTTKHNLSKSEVQNLVFFVIIKKFCRDRFEKEADFIEFNNLQTGESWSIIYMM